MRLLIILLNLFTITVAYGQGWSVSYYLNGDTLTTSTAICETSDGGYVLGGQHYDDLTHISYSDLLKTDLNGNVQWEKRYSFLSKVTAVQSTIDGGYVLTGFDLPNLGMSSSSSKMYLVKTDANGDTLWTKKFGEDNKVNHGLDVQVTPDNGYFIVGHTNGFANGNYKFYAIRTDVNGDTLWTKTYDEGSGTQCLGASIVPTSDGGYLLIGYVKMISGADQDGYVIKIDANGNVLWSKVYANGNDDFLQKAVERSDGGYIFIGGTNSLSAVSYDNYIISTGANGDTLWTKIIGESGIDLGNVILESPDGGYLIVGTSNSFYTPSYCTYLIKIDALGGVEWEKTLKDVVNAGIRSHNGYALVAHKSKINNSQDRYLTLIKIDFNGEILRNRIRGNIFNDSNYDCLQDVGEMPVGGVLVEAIGTDTIYATTDSLGDYTLLVDTGNYIIQINPSVYVQACNNSIPITVTDAQLNDTIDFPLQDQVNCALMQVDLAAPFLMNNGETSRYGISYCNKGTISAIDATIKFIIDEHLNVLGSSVPIASQNGDTLIFNLGTVHSGDCGSFTVDVNVDPGVLLGRTHCSEVYIYPDSICGTSGWSGPIIDAKARCLADSVQFKLYNVGTSTFPSQTYYVFEEHLMLMTVNSGNINTNDSITITIPTDTGKTYRIEIAQVPGFPPLLGDSIESATIEGCSPYPSGAFNTGFVTQFSNGGGSPFNAIDCQENVISYESESKSAQPKGHSMQNYIYNTTELDYKIRFRNTKERIINSVVIRDTISPLLDLSTLEMGASSHPYTWRVYGNRILEIKYTNIMLPDSATNALASNAFVRYRIAQKPNNPKNHVIYNAATLYFDYDQPIISNETWHTIGEDFVQLILITSTVLEPIELFIYPNPFQHSTTLEVLNKECKTLELIVYDLCGRVVAQQQNLNSDKIELKRKNLPSGVYLYRLEGDGSWISSGKIIAQ